MAKAYQQADITSSMTVSIINLLIMSTIMIFLLANTISHQHNHLHTTFARTLSPRKLGLSEEKLTHLHFYFHHIVTRKNPTKIDIAGIEVASDWGMSIGAATMIDGPLTVGPDIGSEQVRTGVGMYGSASQSEEAQLRILNYVFTEGQFNGSTLISILGGDVGLSAVTEMPIVGGSGVFRFARGYAQTKTYTYEQKTGNAIVEYNVDVFHYYYSANFCLYM